MSVENEMENATVGRLPDSDSTTEQSSGSKQTRKEKKRAKKNTSSDKKSSATSSSSSKSGDGSSGSSSGSSADAHADESLDRATGKTTATQDEAADGNKKSSPLKQAAQTGAVLHAASAAGKALVFMKMMLWLKMMMQSAGAAIQSLFQAIVAAITAIVQSVVSAVVGFVTTVATAVGTSVMTAATGLLGGLVAAIVAVAAVVTGVSVQNEAARYDGLVDCATYVEAAEEDAAGNVDVSGLQLEYAQKIYSFYHEMGAPDEQIAGILGNWSTESGIDPTNIECSYLFCSGESYVLGPKKTEIFADLSDYTVNKVFPAYDRSGISLNKPFYKASDDNYYCGLGLGQWTGENALKMLNAANSVNMHWYTLDFQLIYTVVDGGYRVEWLLPWFETTEDSPESAAYSFTRYWEGNVSQGVPHRKASAAQWYVQFADWEVDAEYANSLIELAGVARLDASANGIEESLENCQGERIKYDNSSIAAAAASYAWPGQNDGTHNNGTLLYQCVHDYIFPGDKYYASCCRGGSVAVRWSGSDDTFEIGGCSNQFAYCTASTKWENLGSLTGLSDAERNELLQPGDVLICNNCHTLIYTGNEIIKQIHGEDAPSNYVAVEASYGNKSPVCIPLWTTYYNGAGSNAHDGGPHNFVVWRCVDPDNSTTYEHASDGVSTYVGSSFDPNQYP